MVVAAKEDLLATKLKVLLQRVEIKDYLDIAQLLKSGQRLADGLAGAETLFKEFPPTEAMRTFCYFDDQRLNPLDLGTHQFLIGECIGVVPKSPTQIQSHQLSEPTLTASLSDARQQTPTSSPIKIQTRRKAEETKPEPPSM
jgi:hypothetical protein